MQGLHFLGDRRLALETYPDPHPGPGEVVVKRRAFAEDEKIKLR